MRVKPANSSQINSSTATLLIPPNQLLIVHLIVSIVPAIYPISLRITTIDL